jgi:glycerol dehydrogenase-like iron-containing ADH family enzyme
LRRAVILAEERSRCLGSWPGRLLDTVKALRYAEQISRVVLPTCPSKAIGGGCPPIFH